MDGRDGGDPLGLQGRDLPLARTSSSAARARRACWSRAASCSRNRVPDVPGGGTVAYVNPDEHALPRRPRAPRGGRHAGDHRVDPGRAGLPAQGGRRGRRRSGRARSGFLQRAVAAWRAEPAIEILGNLDAERLSIVSFVVRSPGGPLPAPQLRRRPAQRPLRDPVPRRLLLRRPLRPPAARHRPRALATSSSARSPAAARASSPAGCGSTSTTSSPSGLRLHRRGGAAGRARRLAAARRLPASTRRTGLWRHREGLVEPPLRLAEVALRRRRSAAPPRLPTPGARRVELLAEHLAEARAHPRATRPPPDLAERPGTCRDDFEHLRWFDLPAGAVSGS